MYNFSLENYYGKKVLITGDTGFKGSWLAIWLLKLGAVVSGFGMPPKTDMDNFVVSGLSSKINHCNGDIRDIDTVSRIIEEIGPEIVFHLAAQALVLDSYKNPHLTFETNVMGNVNVLEAVRIHPSVKAVVMVSSDKCYENRGWIQGYRETDPLGGNDPYSASKGASEIVTSSYIRSFFMTEGMPAVASARAGNVIGGGDWSENRIFPDCIRALMQNRPVLIRNPQSIRPWQHVLESLYGYLLLGSALLTQGKNFSGPWNFGPYSNNVVPVEYLVNEVIRAWGNGMYIVNGNDEKGRESSMLNLDSSKAFHLLNWHPVFPLKKAISLAVEEYRVENWPEDAVFCQRCNHIDEYMSLLEAD